MNNHTRVWILLALLTAIVTVPSRAADGVALLKDLTSVVALLGVPCGKVVSATRMKDNDHIATCQDGNRYRVFVNAQGRVVAQKQ
ncbi:hypothetical protein [Methylibium sp.]|uniref:hypothetical protein n=1 Tax=Methylibium sp. TaxID=2067992 RepID=UPI00286CEC2A|nr:hypothetical protein [Methylibium sp.]